jgi:ceramide glucosyltransferase
VLLTAILGFLAFLSLALIVWQFGAACQFPLHSRRPRNLSAPPVTLLKPLKGCDVETRLCLESWFRQDYVESVQILFGVDSHQDPVCQVVHELMTLYPRIDAQLVVCANQLVPNRKVAKLMQIMPEARHDVIVISDSDVRAPADLLSQIVPMVRDGTVGLASCFYRLPQASTVAMRWEAIWINSDFWAQVLQARSLKALDFALGATMVTTKGQLDAVGGFEALGDYLADDFQLGQKLVRAGASLEISPVVVDCREGPMSWRQVWDHQLRWSRTIRVCKPLPYLCSVLSNATFWPILFLLFGKTGGVWIPLVPRALSPRGYLEPEFFVSWGIFVVVISLLVRIITSLILQRRLTGNMDHAAWWWLVPVKDLLQVCLWALAFTGNRVKWRGESHWVSAGGKLAKQLAPQE